MLSQKNGEALHKFSKFDASVNISCRFTINHALKLFAMKCELLVHTKYMLLLPSSMAGLLAIVSPL